MPRCLANVHDFRLSSFICRIYNAIFVARISVCSAGSEKKLDICICKLAILVRISWSLRSSLTERLDSYQVELRDAAVS